MSGVIGSTATTRPTTGSCGLGRTGGRLLAVRGRSSSTE